MHEYVKLSVSKALAIKYIYGIVWKFCCGIGAYCQVSVPRRMNKERIRISMKRFVLLLFSLVAVLAIASCSGRHVEEKPETTPPTIVSIFPADSATDVAITTSVTVTFSEAMDSSTITDATFQLKSVISAKTSTITGTVTYDTVSNVASFTSNSLLEHSTTYIATISTDATDVAGNALSGSFSWSFKTVPAPGTLDVSFGTGGRARIALGSGDAIAYATAIQQNGKIIAAGLSAVSSYQTSTNYFSLVRFLPSGGLDANFNPPTGLGKNDYFPGNCFAVALQSDDKIIAAGSSGDLSRPNSDFFIVRYNDNGSRDISFGNQPAPDGSSIIDMGGTWDSARALALQNDGSIVVVGESTSGGSTYKTVLTRLKIDGTLDPAFGVNGMISNSSHTTVHAYLAKIQSDDMILIAGIFKDVDELTEGLVSSYIARYDPAGALDPSFGSGGMVTISTGTNTTIKAMEILPSGTIIVAGTTTKNTKDLFLMQFDSNGSLDSAFGTNGMTITDDVNHGENSAAGLAIQSDGKIVVAATYLPTSGTNPNNDFALFRYNADGSIDTTFGSGGVGLVTTDFGYNDVAEAVRIQQDGKIVVAGSSTSVLNAAIGIARYWP